MSTRQLAPHWPEQPNARLRKKNSSIILLPDRPLVAAQAVSNTVYQAGWEILGRVALPFRIRKGRPEYDFIEIWQSVAGPAKEDFTFTVAHPAFIRAIHRHRETLSAAERSLPTVPPRTLVVTAPETNVALWRFNDRRRQKEQQQHDFEAALQTLIPDSLTDVIPAADEAELERLGALAAESTSDVLQEKQARLNLRTRTLFTPIGRVAAGQVLAIGSDLAGTTAEMVANDHFGLQFKWARISADQLGWVVQLTNHTVLDLDVISATANEPLLLQP